MNRKIAVRILAGGAVAGALGITTVLAGAQPPGGRYGGGAGGYGGYDRPKPYTACKPGWGFGDRNHCHSGPPGLVGKQKDGPHSGSSPATGATAAKGDGIGHQSDQGGQAQPDQRGNSEANPASGGQPNQAPKLGAPGGSPAQANPQPKPERNPAPGHKPAGDHEAEAPKPAEVEDEEADVETPDDDSPTSDDAKKKDRSRAKQG